ncbi:hypothetical protein ES703_83537 [subsurface metagenome]
MSDKLEELKVALEGLPDDALKLVLEFTEFLKKHGEKKTGEG